jgi:uncharacterized membrane protein
MKTNQVLRIICIFIGIYYFIQFLFGLTGVGMFFSLKDNEYISREAQIFWGIISLFIMLFVGIVFFFGNRSIVRLIEFYTNIHNDNLENSLNKPPNLSIYIIIVGLFYFVNSLTTIVSMFPRDFVNGYIVCFKLVLVEPDWLGYCWPYYFNIFHFQK